MLSVKEFYHRFCETNMAKGAWCFAIASLFYCLYAIDLFRTESNYPMFVWCNFIASLFFMAGSILFIWTGDPNAFEKPGIIFYDPTKGDPNNNFFLYHFGTMNLIAAWLFVAGCLPFFVYSISEICKDVGSWEDWLSLISAYIFTYMTWFLFLSDFLRFLSSFLFSLF